MLLPKRPLRFLILFIALSTISYIYYTTYRTTSLLTENANPENPKDNNGNTKQPDLAPGVGPVIDSHRGEAREDFDFPTVIHQTSPTQALNPATLSWYYANFREEHKFYSNRDALAYVKERASAEVADVYHGLYDPVARADLFRYVVMYEDGGVYADIDTTALCPVNAWIPPEFDMSTIELVVGIEVDEPSVVSAEKIEAWGWSANFQFVQWTMLAKPGHKAMQGVIAEVVQRVLALAEERSQTVANLELSPTDVIKTTGPGPFTAAILKYLDLSSPSPLRGLTKPLQIKDVLVMPVSAFAPNQKHSGSKSVTKVENIPEILVMHGFQSTRSWADEIKSWLLSKVY